MCLSLDCSAVATLSNLTPQTNLAFGRERKLLLNVIIFDMLLNINMQHLLSQTNRLYFAIGDPKKTSFSIQYCRENEFCYLPDPTPARVQQQRKNCIIEGTLSLFRELEKTKPELCLIFVGTDYSNQQERQLREDYLKIGKCYDVPVAQYENFRKALYPNLIFLFGPVQNQNYAASTTLANTIGYSYTFLPNTANEIVTHFDKTRNYVINGFFSNPAQIGILESYFTFRVIQFAYDRQNLPKYDSYFDTEYDLLPSLQGKPYFSPVVGGADPIEIMDQVTQFLCPRLIFLNYSPYDRETYVSDYIKRTDGLKLSILQIQHLRKRKNLPLAKNSLARLNRLTEIFYHDLNRTEILLADFPFETRDFVELENINRKITYFIDLNDPKKHEYSKVYSAAIYFLETQRRLFPSMNQSLYVDLQAKSPYWIVNGSGTCGKTSVAKFLSNEFGFRYIDYEAESAAAKEKIASPEDGQQVPPKKYIDYFGKLVKESPSTVFIFDGINYENDDLKYWVEVLGAPHVINLRIEADEQIKRTRKKAEGDLTAEVSEEETAKANELLEKNSRWCECLYEHAPSSKIYQVDYKFPQLLAQPLIISIIRPRIFLVQENNHLTYQNIAIKHNMGFINLRTTELTDCEKLVKGCGRRDVILCCYRNGEDSIVSKELYWIEKHLGEIRYLGIWNPEDRQIKEEVMALERPPVVEKVKKPEGEEEEEEKQEQPEEGEDGPPKKKFDIFDYEWTQPRSYKNLSQWFFKLKKKVVERVAESPKECFRSFEEVLQILNSDKNSCVYERVR